METEYKNAAGKGAGEVMRDIAEFLSTPCPINKKKQLDLCTLLPELNMHRQMAFALMSEALTQDWDFDAAARFVHQAMDPVTDPAVTDAILLSFSDLDGADFATYRRLYGNRFTMSGGAYWATCLALGIDSGEIPLVMQYLKQFTVILMEFAYMGDRNPAKTYMWEYYESFRKILDELLADPLPAPKPLKLRAIGGSAGQREGDSYPLSLGVDIENPNADRMARDVSVDITLKDKNGAVITVIRDRIHSIDPATVYHFGVTRRIRGAAVASLAATAKAQDHLMLSTPIMKHARLEQLRVKRQASSMSLCGTLTNQYDRPISTLCLHYQLLSEENKILGGGNEWIFDGMQALCPITVSSEIPVTIPSAAKAVYSVDFDAMELI